MSIARRAYSTSVSVGLKYHPPSRSTATMNTPSKSVPGSSSMHSDASNGSTTPSTRASAETSAHVPS